MTNIIFNGPNKIKYQGKLFTKQALSPVVMALVTLMKKKTLTPGDIARIYVANKASNSIVYKGFTYALLNSNPLKKIIGSADELEKLDKQFIDAAETLFYERDNSKRDILAASLEKRLKNIL